MFKIDSTELIDYSLRLQKINGVALPFAVQNSLNSLAKDVKMRTLKQSTNELFDVKRPNFFKANSAFKTYKAKQFGYNINKMHADVGITKGKDPNETTTEQLGKQEEPGTIKRSINPIGNKPQSKKIVDILSKKPEFYDSHENYTEGNSAAYIRRAQKAQRRNAPFVVSKSGKGYTNRVVSIKKRKPTPSDKRKMIIKLKAIASYHKSGNVKIEKQRPFLTNAVHITMRQRMNSEFIKAAEKQIQRVMKK